MPSYKNVESLKQACFMLLAKDIHKISVHLEERKDCIFTKAGLKQLARDLPSIFVEQMICKVIESIHANIQRSRRTIGMETCLEVLLQPHIKRLDLSGLFSKMRLPSSINSTIRNVVANSVARMNALTYFNMVGKCDDEILLTISLHCPNISVIIISISDLVTDVGLKHISLGCRNLERLEIYKCWSISNNGVKHILLNSHNLKEFHCEEMGSVLVTHFKNTDRVFELKHFEQTHAPFEPTSDISAWLEKSCPHIQSVRLYMDDECLPLIPCMGEINSVELEITSEVGTGFNTAIRSLSSCLTTFQLNCESINQTHIVLLGKECPNLATVHITTATIEDDENMINGGQYFQLLTSLHLQVWKEAVINEKCIDFFLCWCHKLAIVVIKAEMEFFTDRCLQRILTCNPLNMIKKLCLTSDKYVPLTLKSAKHLLEACPTLENLTITGWDVSEEEFFEMNTLVKQNNYDFAIT